jgi:hypothetical protein
MPLVKSLILANFVFYTGQVTQTMCFFNNFSHQEAFSAMVEIHHCRRRYLDANAFQDSLGAAWCLPQEGSLSRASDSLTFIT